MRENKYQSYIIDQLEKMFPGCFILKNDSAYLQGVPDLLILYQDKWAMLEIKVRKNTEPNQEYWVEHLNQMSFAAFIEPDNEEDVLYELQRTFAARR